MQRAEMEEEESTIVSRARTAFNSAAAKAEKVFADFKSDLRGLSFSLYPLFSRYLSIFSVEKR